LVPRRTAEPSPLPEGFAYHGDFITVDEERVLLGVVHALDFPPLVMRGRTARRSVRHFGLEYSYQRKELASADPLPEPMLWLRTRCSRLLERDSDDLVQVIVGRYPAGAGIGWHRDAAIFGSGIVGVSLLSASRMRFQRREGDERRVAELELEPRSGYLMSGDSRWGWEHSIPATKALRYSITFRTLRTE
jgi:DNA oxidative demethylase